MSRVCCSPAVAYQQIQLNRDVAARRGNGPPAPGPVEEGWVCGRFGSADHLVEASKDTGFAAVLRMFSVNDPCSSPSPRVDLVGHCMEA
jgi:hypothetical protein